MRENVAIELNPVANTPLPPPQNNNSGSHCASQLLPGALCIYTSNVTRAMPKVLESISRRFRKSSNGVNDNLEYLLSDWGPTGDFLESRGHIAHSDADVDSDSAGSTCSFSTNATVDDNPGPGRLVDKYVYQRLGRKIEKLLPTPTTPPPHESESSALVEVGSIISASSFSTNATIDDNPGPGRLIDKHIYQFLGRKMERVIFRIKVNTLPPAAIVRYIEMMFSAPFAFEYSRSLPLSRLLADLDKRRVGSTIISGLKGLIRQTQYACES